MERKERIAWSAVVQKEQEQVGPVELQLTPDEVGDLTRVLAIYQANSLTVARTRSLTNDELHAHETAGKVRKQIEGWKPKKNQNVSPPVARPLRRAG